MDYILTTDKITKKFSKVTAVDAVSIHVARGEVYGLIGRNGAGKTTLLKMLGTLSFPTEGSFTITGVNGESTKAMMPRVGVLIEDPGIYQNLSAFQNLKAKALAFGMKDDNYLRQLLVLVGLGGVEKKPVKNFSLGMKQRLGIALAMVNSPELLLLDEEAVVIAGAVANLLVVGLNHVADSVHGGEVEGSALHGAYFASGYAGGVNGDEKVGIDVALEVENIRGGVGDTSQ
jgi:ABC-type Na+ transport system ATPase subunit NatA